MHYHFKVHKEKDGFWAECLELDGCQTQAKSLEDLADSAYEALNLYLSEEKDSTLIFDCPKKYRSKDILKVEVDPGVAIALLLRQTRLRHHLTQHEMKDALGIKNLSNYQRLEDPRRANPELRTLINILKTFPEIEFENLINSYRNNREYSA